MQLISIDLETSGLNPEIHQILEVGCVLFDTEKNERKTFQCYVQHENYIGDAFALALNHNIFEILSKDNYNAIDEIIVSIDYLGEYLSNFFYLNDVKFPLTVCGKNFAGFDKLFLTKLKGYNEKWFRHRVLDIGSLYFNPMIDNCLPSLSECKKRAGLEEKVSHKALDDANDVIDLIVRYYKFSI